MADDKQVLLRNFLDENKISIYDVVNCGYWRQKSFLEKTFHYIGSNPILSEITEYFNNHSSKFGYLEEDVTQNKYVIISSGGDKDFYSTGFKSILYLKTWISELNTLVPICLIIDGVRTNKEFSKSIKYDIKIEE